MDKTQRRESEDILGYAKRLINGKKSGIYDLDYVEMYELLFDMELSSTEIRKRSYGINDLIGAIDGEKHSDIANTTLYDCIVEQQRELKKERVKLSDANREYNKIIREESRAEMFEEKIIQAIEGCMKPLNKPVAIKRDASTSKASVLLISDIHYGKEFEIKGLEGETLNAYSVSIFESRMWKLFDEVVINLEKENMEHIHIFNLADSVEGVLRANSGLMKLKFGITDSIMLFTNFIGNWLNELSKHVTIDYYQNTGNHSDYRIVSGKKGDFPKENGERLIGWALKGMLKDNSNIKIHEEQNLGLIYTNIAGFDILATHGDKERKLENSIKDYGQLYNKNIDMMLVGHKHFASESNIGIDKTVIQAPSIIGICDFSMSIKKSANSGAKMFILEEGYGRSVDYNIILD